MLLLCKIKQIKYENKWCSFFYIKIYDWNQCPLKYANIWQHVALEACPPTQTIFYWTLHYILRHTNVSKCQLMWHWLDFSLGKPHIHQIGPSNRQTLRYLKWAVLGHDPTHGHFLHDLQPGYNHFWNQVPPTHFLMRCWHCSSTSP